MKAHFLRNSLVVLLVFARGFVPSSAFAEDASKIYLDGMKSAVKIYNIEQSASGSGSVVNLGEGYILTNWHVVQDGKDVLIVFPKWDQGAPVQESKEYKPRRIGLLAKIVVSEQKVDLAIVKIVDPKKIPEGTAAVKFAEKSPLPLAKLVSIGNPGANNDSPWWIPSPGEVRSVTRKQWEAVDANGKNKSKFDARIILATSPVNPGDSGGPCFNEKGEQVGVTQGYAPGAQANSFFIEASEVKAFLKAKKIPINGEDAPNADVAKKEAGPMPEINKDPMPMKKDPPKADPAAEKKANDEKAAASMLNLLRPLAKDPNRQSFALEKLQSLIKMYPDTEAAKEARELLKKIK